MIKLMRIIIIYIDNIRGIYMFSVIVGILIWVLIIGVLFFFTNKFKYKNIFSKILILVVVGISFYKIFTEGFHNLGIINGAIILGLTWGLIFAVHTEYIIKSLGCLLFTCIAGWVVSFIIACLEFANIPFDTSIRTAALIGLGLSAISTLFSSGEFFPFVNDDYTNSLDNISENKKKDRKITAETFHWGNHLSTTTLRDEDGNETKIDHWKWN